MNIADDIPTPPPADSIAFFVKMQRHHWCWKQSVLASMAGVSLSTVQRVESAETVSPDNLAKIAVALGFPADYLTAPRHKLSEGEAMQRIADSMAWMEGMVEVPLSQLTTEKQLRDSRRHFPPLENSQSRRRQAHMQLVRAEGVMEGSHRACRMKRVTRRFMAELLKP